MEIHEKTPDSNVYSSTNSSHCTAYNSLEIEMIKLAIAMTKATMVPSHGQKSTLIFNAKFTSKYLYYKGLALNDIGFIYRLSSDFQPFSVNFKPFSPP